MKFMCTFLLNVRMYIYKYFCMAVATSNIQNEKGIVFCPRVNSNFPLRYVPPSTKQVDYDLEGLNKHDLKNIFVFWRYQVV